VILGCFPGYVDENMDIGGPYAASNGCEYLCFPSNAGVEACDTLDNDCDGTADEGINTATDPNNCGMCGRTCEFFEATAHCTNGSCVPVIDCAAGYVDVDHVQANGCEYQCSPTNGGIEACDVRDNDCDGSVDETFNLMTDPQNCGLCGLPCQFAHATASCVIGDCMFDPDTDCNPGFVDADGSQLYGCD
jgi:Notch 1